MRLRLGLFVAACFALAFPCSTSAQQVISDPNIIHSQYRANKINAIDRYNNKNFTVVGIVDDVEMGYVQIDSRVPLGGSVSVDSRIISLRYLA